MRCCLSTIGCPGRLGTRLDECGVGGLRVGTVVKIRGCFAEARIFERLQASAIL